MFYDASSSIYRRVASTSGTHQCQEDTQDVISGKVNGLILPNHDVSINQPCPGCMFGKMQRSKFKLDRTRATQIGKLFHSDVCDPMHIATPRGSKYFVLFTDDFSGYRTVYFLKQKSVKKINSKSPTPLKNSSILCVQRPDNQFTH